MRNSDAQALKGARGGEAGYCGMKIILASVAGVIVGVALPLILVFVVFKKDDDEVLPRPASDADCLARCTARIEALTEGTGAEQCAAAIVYTNEAPDGTPIVDHIDYTLCTGCTCDGEACDGDNCAGAVLANATECDARTDALILDDGEGNAQTCAVVVAAFESMTEAHSDNKDYRHCTRLCECGGENNATPMCSDWRTATPEECTAQLTAYMADDGEGNTQTCTEAHVYTDGTPMAIVPRDWTEGVDYSVCEDYCSCDGDALDTCAYPAADSEQCHVAVVADIAADGGPECAAAIVAIGTETEPRLVGGAYIDYSGCSDLCETCNVEAPECGVHATQAQCWAVMDNAINVDGDQCADTDAAFATNNLHRPQGDSVNYRPCEDLCGCDGGAGNNEPYCAYTTPTAEQCQTRCRGLQAEEGTCNNAHTQVAALANTDNVNRLNYGECTCNCDGADCVCE